MGNLCYNLTIIYIGGYIMIVNVGFSSLFDSNMKSKHKVDCITITLPDDFEACIYAVKEQTVSSYKLSVFKKADLIQYIENCKDCELHIRVFVPSAYYDYVAEMKITKKSGIYDSVLYLYNVADRNITEIVEVHNTFAVEMNGLVYYGVEYSHDDIVTSQLFDTRNYIDFDDETIVKFVISDNYGVAASVSFNANHLSDATIFMGDNHKLRTVFHVKSPKAMTEKLLKTHKIFEERDYHEV